MLIDNRYLVEDELGRGGMGIVYRCRDQVLKKFVAVKFLHVVFDAETETMRFHRESVINARLKHKNIIEVLDFGQTDSGELFLVSEYLEGETLQAYLKRKGSLGLQEALPIFSEICDGLAHAHKQGVMHRDIKPANIMVLEDRSVARIKIMDLGIAHVENSTEQRLTRPGASLGTPCYISPEQSLNEPLDLRTDIYSLGCLMFEVLAGAPPFKDETAIETIILHRTKPVPSLSDFGVTDYGEPVERVLGKCLAKDREDRYTSVEQLKADLEQLAESETWKHVTITGGIRFHGDGRRNIGWLLLFLVLVGVGATAIWAVAQGILEDERETPGKRSSAPIIDRNTSPYEKVSKSIEKAYTVTVDTREDGAKLYRVHGQISDERLRDVVHDLPEMRYLLLHGDIYDGIGFAFLRSAHLRGLVLSENSLPDSGLANLSLLPELEELVIDRCIGFSNKGLESLSRAPRLKSLTVEGGFTDDTTVGSIAAIGGLQHVGLQLSPSLTGATIARLAKLQRLDYLELQESGFQIEHLKELTKLKRLKKLDLSDLKVSDKDLPAIVPLKLKTLKLGNNNITDAGLKTLSRMTTLEKLDLSDCNGITRSGGRDFGRALPGCVLEFDPCDRVLPPRL